MAKRWIAVYRVNDVAMNRSISKEREKSILNFICEAQKILGIQGNLE
jgi:hypothetical protein